MKIKKMIFRWLRMSFFIFINLFGVVLFSQNLQSQTLTHIKGQVYRLDPLGNFPIARNESVEGSQIIVDAHSQIQISWKNNNFLEVIGPARFQVTPQNLIAEYGRFLFVNLGSSFPKRVHTLETSFRPSSQSVLEIDISPRRLYSQIIVWQGTLSLLGEVLMPQHLYLFDKTSLQKGELSPEFSQKRLHEYSFSRLHIQDFSEKVSLHSWRNQLIGSVNVHMASRNTFGFGTRMEWNHKRYLQFPLRPQRIHYLKAPAWRIGAGLSFQNTSLGEAPLNTPNKLTLIGPHIASGFSWLGLSAEAVCLYSLTKNSAFAPINALSYSLRIRHEWDLQEITLADLMISLGYELSPLNLEATPYKNKVARHSIELGLHFNF